MKRGTNLPINTQRPGFPLLSQKGAGEGRLQMKVGKRFGVLSTDSQGSSQQQGVLVLFSVEFSCRRGGGCGFLRQ
jgi:hypothetical protein